MDDRELRKTKWALFASALSLFLCWETFKHVFLMNVPMLTNHLVSTVVEAFAALAVSALGAHLLGQVAEARRSQQSFSRTIGAALGSSVTLGFALRDLRLIASELEGEQPFSQVRTHDHSQTLLRHARDIETALRALSGLAPTVLPAPSPSEAADPDLSPREVIAPPRSPQPSPWCGAFNPSS